ncbi:hypothetical protein SK128_017051, partial [Halocaridina rubra]
FIFSSVEDYPSTLVRREKMTDETVDSTQSREIRNSQGHALNNDVPPGKFKEHPTDRNHPLKCPLIWLNGKRIDDNIGPYWRIHNKLYDLTDFINRHPGGRTWLECTKGTDITEAFESAHISLAAEKILPKYFVKDIHTPRNSPYTFHEDGFYRTLKRKVRPILEKTGRGPSLGMIIIQDGLLLAFLSLLITGSLSDSYARVILAGFFLSMTCMCAHNFFHQRDNFRMYYFDLTLMSSFDWRISHSLSHHLFTNTRYDFEISMLEPYWEFLPDPKKTLTKRYGSYFYELLLLPHIFYLEIIKKIILIWKKKIFIRPENILPLVELVVMCLLAPSIGDGIRLWFVMHSASSTWFLFIGIFVAHHHPEIYHEGDKFRTNPDWGLCQMDAVRDRNEITGNLFLVSTTFGDHTLHHLLPTVDHSKLDALYPAFFETCEEFNIPFEFLSSWDLLKGKYRQLANNTPNTSQPGYKAKAH